MRKVTLAHYPNAPKLGDSLQTMFFSVIVAQLSEYLNVSTRKLTVCNLLLIDWSLFTLHRRTRNNPSLMRFWRFAPPSPFVHCTIHTVTPISRVQKKDFDTRRGGVYHRLL